MNQQLQSRMDGIQSILIAGMQAGSAMSAASKGHERELLMDGFLSRVLPPQYRFGSGDAIDSYGRQSGQLDVVIEYGLQPSLPVVNDGPRLYLAEGIAAVIEVKSDLAGQWGEVVSTANKLSPLARNFGGGIQMGPGPSPQIPLFAVGYRGWSKFETLRAKRAESGIAGILVIENGNFVSDGQQCVGIGGEIEQSSLSLWALVSCVHALCRIITSRGIDSPVKYIS